MSWWTADRQTYAVSHLMANGLSQWGAAALVSRWANVESSGGPTSVNRRSGAFGIAQWLGARKTPIAGNTNFESQLAYVVSELNGTESRAGRLLRSAGDAYSGAVGASTYERAEGYNQSTGVDNFTSRTAAGVDAVLQIARIARPAVDEYYDPPALYDSPMLAQASLPTAEPISTGVIMLGAAVVLLDLLWITE